MTDASAEIAKLKSEMKNLKALLQQHNHDGTLNMGVKIKKSEIYNLDNITPFCVNNGNVDSNGKPDLLAYEAAQENFTASEDLVLSVDGIASNFGSASKTLNIPDGTINAALYFSFTTPSSLSNQPIFGITFANGIYFRFSIYNSSGYKIRTDYYNGVTTGDKISGSSLLANTTYMGKLNIYPTATEHQVSITLYLSSDGGANWVQYYSRTGSYSAALTGDLDLLIGNYSSSYFTGTWNLGLTSLEIDEEVTWEAFIPSGSVISFKIDDGTIYKQILFTSADGTSYELTSLPSIDVSSLSGNAFCNIFSDGTNVAAYSNTIYRQYNEPSAPSENDIWLNTMEYVESKIYSGGDWADTALVPLGIVYFSDGFVSSVATFPYSDNGAVINQQSILSSIMPDRSAKIDLEVGVQYTADTFLWIILSVSQTFINAKFKVNDEIELQTTADDSAPQDIHCYIPISKGDVFQLLDCTPFVYKLCNCKGAI